MFSLRSALRFTSPLYASQPQIRRTARRRRRPMGDLIAAGLGLALILVMAAYAELCERI
jgi:hypothetical protein